MKRNYEKTDRVQVYGLVKKSNHEVIKEITQNLFSKDKNI